MLCVQFGLGLAKAVSNRLTDRRVLLSESQRGRATLDHSHPFALSVLSTGCVVHQGPQTTISLILGPKHQMLKSHTPQSGHNIREVSEGWLFTTSEK